MNIYSLYAECKKTWNKHKLKIFFINWYDELRIYNDELSLSIWWAFIVFKMDVSSTKTNRKWFLIIDMVNSKFTINYNEPLF